MLAGYTQLSATTAPSTSRINTPSAWSKPQHDAVHRKGRTPIRGQLCAPIDTVRATRLDQAWVFELVAQRPVAIAAARSAAATATPAASDSRNRQHRDAEHEGCGHEFFAHCISPSFASMSNIVSRQSCEQ